MHLPSPKVTKLRTYPNHSHHLQFQIRTPSIWTKIQNWWTALQTFPVKTLHNNYLHKSVLLVLLLPYRHLLLIPPLGPLVVLSSGLVLRRNRVNEETLLTSISQRPGLEIGMSECLREPSCSRRPFIEGEIPSFLVVREHQKFLSCRTITNHNLSTIPSTVVIHSPFLAAFNAPTNNRVFSFVLSTQQTEKY